MYPLNVTMVACLDDVQHSVLSMLIHQQANLEGQYSDVDSCIAALRDDSRRTRLYIVSAPDSSSLPKLRQLVSVFAGQPVLALVDAMRDPAVLLGAMRSGAAQVVPLPIHPEDFRAAMDCIAQQYGSAATQGQVVAVSGVTGGCGATAIAVNLAYDMATQHHQHVILSELSLQIGKLAAYLDINPDHTTFDLLSDGDRLDPMMIQRALTKVAERFDVLAGEYRAISPMQVKSANVIRLIDYCRSLASVAVFDVPCTYDDMYFDTLAAADQVVLVGEQKIPSIKTLKLVCEALSRIDGARKLHIIINRYDPRLTGFNIDRLKTLLEVDGLLTVCNDFAAVMSSINHGRPLRLESPRSPALSDISKVVHALLGGFPNAPSRTGQTGQKSTSKIGKFISRFGLTS
jgi:pilus assembly protein CpaE